MSSTTLSIRVPIEVSDRLGKLAAVTRRSQSYLAAEALAAYVERELSIIATGAKEGGPNERMTSKARRAHWSRVATQ